MSNDDRDFGEDIELTGEDQEMLCRFLPAVRSLARQYGTQSDEVLDFVRGFLDVLTRYSGERVACQFRKEAATVLLFAELNTEGIVDAELQELLHALKNAFDHREDQDKGEKK